MHLCKKTTNQGYRWWPDMPASRGDVQSLSWEFAFLAAGVGAPLTGWGSEHISCPPGGMHIVPWNKQMWPRTAHFYPQLKK